MIDTNPNEACVRGVRYTANVPDTLDLADRMGLAINALTRAWYPDEHWGHGLNIDFSRRPAVLWPNDVTDGFLNVTPKFLEALTLCRAASGNTDRMDVDFEVLKAQLALLGDDGLTYSPMEAFPEYKEDRPFSEVWAEGRFLLVVSMLTQIDDNPIWADIGRRKIDRLLSLTKEKENFRFLWSGRFRPGEMPPADADEPDRPMEWGSLARRDPVFNMIYSIGALGHGTGLFGRVTGYEPAVDLAGGLARWAMARMFSNEDGSYTFWHYHHGLYALLAVCEYGLLVGDQKVLERADACFRFARDMGDPLIGWFPEGMPGSPWFLDRRGNTVEICEVSDMVLLALYLTEAGLGDYWDDVDRWVRNVYAEGQLTDLGFLDDIPESYFNPEPADRTYADTSDVAERSVGSFLGWMRANDGLQIDQTDAGPKLAGRNIMHCCTGNGARTLYYVWDRILTQEADEVRVNLLLNRASPWLDVDSYLPVRGEVRLHIKDARRVAVRMPEWCDPHGVRVTVAGEPYRAVADGRHVRIGYLKPGDEVALTFDVPERRVHRVIGEIPYTLKIRGSNVVEIDPKGVGLPLYEKQPTGKTIEKERFVSDVRGLVW